MGRQGVPGLLHLGEREHRLAPGPLGRGAHQIGTLHVGALESTPAQAPLGVLVVEQEDQPVRRTEVAAAVPQGGWCREVFGQAVHQLGGGVCLGSRGVGGGEQVEREHHPVPGPDGRDLVTAVGVERDEGQLLLRRAVGDALPSVVDDQFPTGVRRRQ